MLTRAWLAGLVAAATTPMLVAAVPVVPGSPAGTGGAAAAVEAAAVLAPPSAVVRVTPDAASPPASARPRVAPAVRDWRPQARRGLTGPVADVLAGAPAKGPVRVTRVTVDAQGRPRITVVTAADRTKAAAAVLAARKTAGVVAVGVDQRATVADIATVSSAMPSDDTYRDQQWGLDRLSAEDAQAISDGTGQVVAVVDTGVDATHPDLAGQVLTGQEYLANGGASTGDGHHDQHGHGTHVSGIIAALSGNQVGIAGLAPGVKILPIRVLGATGSGWMSDVATGITAATDAGASVINLSLGSQSSDAGTQAAVAYALAHHVVVVAAAGNARQPCAGGETSGCGNPPIWPASYPGVIGVAAAAVGDTSGYFSETGSFVDITAPGVGILSSVPAAVDAGLYQSWSGTSMATPFVAASAAMIRAHRPDLDEAGVAALLTATAQDLGSCGRDNEFGQGMVDPLAALQVQEGDQLPSAPVCPVVKVATHTGLSLSAARVTSGGTVRIVATVRKPDNHAALGTVRFCAMAFGSTASTCANVATNSLGQAAWTVRASVGTTFSAYYAGSDSTTSSLARTTVGVLPRVAVSGGRRTLTVAVAPAQRQTLVVQRYRSGKWRTVATRTATGATWRLTRLPAGQYRVGIGATRQLLGVVVAARVR